MTRPRLPETPPQWFVALILAAMAVLVVLILVACDDTRPATRDRGGIEKL